LTVTPEEFRMISCERVVASTPDRDRSSRSRSVTGLVARARAGDQQAWNELVERYAPLVWSICRRYRLAPPDAADVGQSVWLALIDQLDDLREPAALPGWLATATRRECGRVLRRAARSRPCDPLDFDVLSGGQAAEDDADLLTAERHAALRAAFEDLPPACQQLIALFIGPRSRSYAEIGTLLGLPIGSIGPNRRRCLERMRRHPAVAALIDAEPAGT
jgi:RNA polymerase sigma factor (sigma-70 family)